MTSTKGSIVIGILCLFIVVLPGPLCAQDLQEDNAQDAIALIREQNSKLAGELRRIHREIAALRADFDKPDVKDVFGGIGYIFGLCGVAAFVAARRKEQHGLKRP